MCWGCCAKKSGGKKTFIFWGEPPNWGVVEMVIFDTKFPFSDFSYSEFHYRCRVFLSKVLLKKLYMGGDKFLPPIFPNSSSNPIYPTPCLALSQSQVSAARFCHPVFVTKFISNGSLILITKLVLFDSLQLIGCVSNAFPWDKCVLSTLWPTSRPHSYATP